MEDKRLIRYLNSVGKGCFVEYFELFLDALIPNKHIAEQMCNEKGYTMKACMSRTGHARMIIREGGAEDALRLIIGSSRMDAPKILEARCLLKTLV